MLYSWIATAAVSLFPFNNPMEPRKNENLPVHIYSYITLFYNHHPSFLFFKIFFFFSFMFLFLFIVCVNWNDSLHLSCVEFWNCHFCPTLPTHINPPHGPANSCAGPPAPPRLEWTANPWNVSASIERLPLKSYHWWTPKFLSKGLSVLDIFQTVHLPLVLDTCETRQNKNATDLTFFIFKTTIQII